MLNDDRMNLEELFELDNGPAVIFLEDYKKIISLEGKEEIRF